MSHILLATDGSESAQEAISFLHKLLRPGFAEKITIVSVVNEHETELLLSVPDVNIPGGTLEELEDSEEQEAKDIARTAMAAVKGLAPDVQAVVLRGGAPGRDIVEAAKNYGAELVVVGSRGQGEVKSLLLGSVSEYVLHHAPCPVLVVKVGSPG